MAKIKKTKQIYPKPNLKPEKKDSSWLENKIARIRSLARPVAARASRYGAPAGVGLLLLIVAYSLLLPKDRFQQAKEAVLKNPNDFQARLVLAEEFLKNNDLQKAEKELLSAQSTINNPQLTMNNQKVLGLSTKLEELWNQWRSENPEEIKKEIAKWEEFLAHNPTYRDGYLQLTLLYFKLDQKDKAQESLQKALDLDPNYEVAREIEIQLK